MPWMTIAAVLVVSSTLYYAWFILNAYRGLRPLDPKTRNSTSPRVSVIVAARNEESDLPVCLAALAAQDYTQTHIEFIVVDDGSEDRTAAIVNEQTERDQRFHLLQLGKQDHHQPSRKRGRKPEALAAGIDRASGEIILITDADCRPGETWVRTMVSQFTDNVAYVVGPVIEENHGTLFSAIRSLEILGLTGMAGGRIGSGHPLNSLGGNLAFRKDVYIGTGGFDYRQVKSDEETMMHRILEAGLGRVIFAADRSARVTTSSAPDLGGFWNQRKRWGSMHGRFADKAILAELTVLYLALLIPVVSLALLPAYPSLWPWVAGFFTVKALIDGFMLRKCANLFGEPFSPGVFLLAETFHTFYLIIVSAVAQFSRYTWKDRTVLTIETTRSGS